jgi:hypothetical protein
VRQRIKQRPQFPSILAKMKTAIQEDWDRLEPQGWNKYINSIPERIRELKQRRGLQTQY